MEVNASIQEDMSIGKHLTTLAISRPSLQWKSKLVLNCSFIFLLNLMIYFFYLSYFLYFYDKSYSYVLVFSRLLVSIAEHYKNLPHIYFSTYLRNNFSLRQFSKHTLSARRRKSSKSLFILFNQ